MRIGLVLYPETLLINLITANDLVPFCGRGSRDHLGYLNQILDSRMNRELLDFRMR